MYSQLDSWISKPGENHGPLMAALLWTLFGISTIFLALRLLIRYTSAKIWIDDLVLVISWVCLLLQITVNQLAINLGFGKHALDIDFKNFDKIVIYGASTLTFSTIATNMSKISFAITLIRLTKGLPRYYIWFSIVSLVAFAIPTIVLPWTLCKPLAKTLIDFLPGTCVDKRPSVIFAQFQAIYSAVIDLFLALIPWVILWNVQMRTAEKIGVGVAMSLGVLAGATAVIRGHYVEELARQDVSYDAISSMVWSGAETVATIIATSIPVLRVFLKKAVNTAMGKYRSNNSHSKSSTNDRSQSSKSSKDQSKDSRKSETYIILDDLAAETESTRAEENPSRQSLSHAPELKVEECV